MLVSNITSCSVTRRKSPPPSLSSCDLTSTSSALDFGSSLEMKGKGGHVCGIPVVCPRALVLPGGKQTGNGRVRLFAVGWVRLGRGHFVLLWAHVGIICGRGICATHHLLTIREGILASTYALTICGDEGICASTMFTSGESLGSSQVVGKTGTCKEQMGDHWNICLHHRFGFVCSR